MTIDGSGLLDDTGTGRAVPFDGSKGGTGDEMKVLSEDDKTAGLGTDSSIYKIKIKLYKKK